MKENKKSEGVYIGIVEDAKEPIFISYDSASKPNILTVAEAGRGIDFSHKSKILREKINSKYE